LEDLVSRILPPLLAAFAVSASLAYVHKKAKEGPADGQLGYGSEVKALGWFLMMITVGVLFVMAFVDHGGQYVPLISLAALSGCLGLPLLLESYTMKGYFDERRILVSSVWSRPKQGFWDELKEAVFKKNGQYFELRFTDGTKISLSKFLRGHRAVCQHVESLGFTIQDSDKA
jgi:hypothetical protein